MLLRSATSVVQRAQHKERSGEIAVKRRRVTHCCIGGNHHSRLAKFSCIGIKTSLSVCYIQLYRHQNVAPGLQNLVSSASKHHSRLTEFSCSDTKTQLLVCFHSVVSASNITPAMQNLVGSASRHHSRLVKCRFMCVKISLKVF